MSWWVLTISAAIVLVIALVIAALFIAVVVGIRQAHSTDLALRRPAYLEALARRVLGLYVRRGGPGHRADWTAERDRIAL